MAIEIYLKETLGKVNNLFTPRCYEYMLLFHRREGKEMAVIKQ